MASACNALGGSTVVSRSSAFLLPLIVGALSVQAQGWQVGEPVDVVLSHAYLFGGSCTPAPSCIFAFPTSAVSGVEYIALVTLAYPGSQITVTPGPAGALNAGDTIWIDSEVQRAVHYPLGGGNINLQFKAIGIPVVPGEPHPCTVNDAWQSDFVPCPDTHSIQIENACATELPTRVPAIDDALAMFTFPTAANGYRLAWNGASFANLFVYDALGRKVLLVPGAIGSVGSIDMNGLRSGIHILRIETVEGVVMSRAFHVSTGALP